MELNTELIDISSDFNPLRLVLFELTLYIGNLHRFTDSGFDVRMRNRGGFPAVLAIHCHSGGGRIDDERSSAIRAGENDVAARWLG